MARVVKVNKLLKMFLDSWKADKSAKLVLNSEKGELSVILRIRIRVYAGSRGLFACLNHDKDQPCRAVQQSA